MNSTEIVLLILVLAALLGGIAPWVALVLKKRGIDVSGALDKAQSALTVADKMIDGIAGLAPAAPGITTVDKIIEWASKAVNASEQLLKSQQLSADRRKANAEEMVKSCLTSAGISVTPDMEKIIDGAIEAAVLTLPQTGTDVKTVTAEAKAAQTQAENTEQGTDNPQVARADMKFMESNFISSLSADQMDQIVALLNAIKASKAAVQPVQNSQNPTNSAAQLSANEGGSACVG